ncbi:MAG: hypothetical protein ACRECX_03685 [Methyloceanibacter sp.]|uniref:hypothetical protein n=1 Tax=Methyloceanibacter sp. TaxID=1965321 RepID=UPI003D6CCCFE
METLAGAAVEPPVAAWVAGPVREALPEAAEVPAVAPEPGAQPAAVEPGVQSLAPQPVEAVVKPAKRGRTSCSEPCALQVEAPP